MAIPCNLIADADSVLYNRRVKVNPLTGEVLEDMCCSRPIFNPTGAVLRKPSSFSSDEKLDGGKPCEEMVENEPTQGASDAQRRAARRARKQLFELCACNDLDLFFTLTLDKELIDRYDYKGIVRKFGQWADNRVRRKGLRYVAVPELHKDGAVHFHGLCNAAAVRLVDSGRTDKKSGQTIFNLPDWSFGFTTAIYIYGAPGAAAQYVAKYVTKQAGGGTIGGRYYLHGGDLQRARCTYYHEDYDAYEGKEIECGEGAAMRIKYAI